MTDFQPQQGQNWSDKNPMIGTGEGEVPLANTPLAEATMRTMSSDVASIKESGGGEPKPYNPQVENLQPMQSFSEVPIPQPEIGGVAPMAPQQEYIAPKPKMNMYVIIVGILVAVVVIVLGYFFVYPLLSPSVQTPPAQQVVPNPEAQVPAAGEPLPPNPSETTTTSAVVPPEAPATGPATVVMHSSLFKTSADASSEVTLASLALPEVKKAIQSGSVEVPIFKEIVFKNDTGKVYAASSILSVFIPSVFTENVSSLFEKDFSFFTYVDKTDVWPGVVLKLAVGADITAAKAEIAKLEINNEIGSLFFSQPGTASVWKDGKVGSFAGRYIPFSTKGFAFNYAWVNDYLILSTSYVGEQAAVKNLGF